MKQQQLDMLSANYAMHKGTPFNGFYCPIQLRETNEELCDGHVISDAFGDSSQTIVQVKNVDNCFGGTVEAKSIAGARATATPSENVIRDLKPPVKINILANGKKVQHYSADKPKIQKQAEESESQTVVSIPDADGNTYTIGLNLSNAKMQELLQCETKWEVESSCDFSAEMIGTILHSAHLTMFAIMKYKYVFSAGGTEMAGILKKYYQLAKSIKKDPQKLATENQNYFSQFENRVRALPGEIANQFKGTIEDNIFVAWVSSSKKYIAFGVFVKTGGVLHIVWMCGGDPDCVSEFLLLDNQHPPEMRVRIMRFEKVSDHEVKVAMEPELRTWKWVESDKPLKYF